MPDKSAVVEDGAIDVAGGRVAARRRVMWGLVAVSIALTVVSYLVLVLTTPLPVVVPEHPREFLNVNNEQNLPAWWSTFLLATAAAAQVLTGILARVTGHRGAGAWFLVALAVGMMSLDEQTALHERLEVVGRSLVTDVVTDHPFRWTAPGAAIALALLVGFWLTARHLPRTAGRTLLAGIAVLLVSAVGLEFLGGRVLLSETWATHYTALYHVEELGENLGAILLIAAAYRAVAITRGDDGWLLAYRGESRAGHGTPGSPGVDR